MEKEDVGDHADFPSSPPSSSEVKIKDCIEELVKFTLVQSQSQSQDSVEGLAPNPLYKSLASALLMCMDSQSFCWTGCDLATTLEDTTSLLQKHDEWHKLIVEKGSEIVNILKSVSFELHVQEPFFSQLNDGLKTIEGRCASSKYSRMELGNLILINKSVVFEVKGVQRYPTFSDMLEAESLGKVLPGVESVEEGVKVYRRFYTEEQERANGVVGIAVSKMARQPYISLANLLSGLSYEGIQSLLGLMHTRDNKS